MRKILIFSLAYFPLIGGAEVAIREIAKRNPEFEFDLLTAKFKKELPRQEKIDNINVYRLGLGNYFDKYLYFWLAFLKAGEFNRQRKYNLIWAMMANYAGLSALLFKRAHPEIKYLLTLQEGDSEVFLRRRTWFWQPIYKKIYTEADHIQVISNYLAKRAQKMGVKCPIDLVPNGVDFENFAKDFSEEELKELKASLKIKDNEKVIITVSRLVEKNGVDDLIRAIKELKLKRDNLPVKLLIIGDGKDKDELTELTRRLDLKNEVLFLGQIDHWALPRCLKIADVFVRPSLSEGLGNVFLEAMAAGLPIIGTPVGGIPDFLTDYETGLFCEIRNPESIAEKILELIDKPELAQTLTKNGQKLVLEKYDWDKVAGQMKEIFLNEIYKANKSLIGRLLVLTYSKIRFIKYCVVGTIAAAVDFSFLYVLTEFVGIYYLISSLFSFIFSASTNFTLNKYWTFKNQSKAVTAQFTTFLFIVIIGLGFNLILMYILTEKLGLWYMLSKAITIALGLFWNYTGNKHFTFRT
ncbi:MAG: glycosyltransferase [bacterium]